MTAPTITGAAAWDAAKKALNTFLDTSEHPWEDALTMITWTAIRRHAFIVEKALWTARLDGLDKAARFQDLADKMTDPPSPEDRDIDAEIKQWFSEDR